MLLNRYQIKGLKSRQFRPAQKPVIDLTRSLSPVRLATSCAIKQVSKREQQKEQEQNALQLVPVMQTVQKTPRYKLSVPASQAAQELHVNYSKPNLQTSRYRQKRITVSYSDLHAQPKVAAKPTRRVLEDLQIMQNESYQLDPQ